MRYQASLNKDVINTWIDDLLKPPKSFPTLNMNYELVEAKERVTDEEGKSYTLLHYEGDPALFLLARYDREEGKDVKQALGEKRTFDVIAAYTNIPKAHADELVNPQVLTKMNYPIENITGAQFVDVLRNYLTIGVVDWSVILTEQELIKMLKKLPKPTDKVKDLATV